MTLKSATNDCSLMAAANPSMGSREADFGAGSHGSGAKKKRWQEGRQRVELFTNYIPQERWLAGTVL